MNLIICLVPIKQETSIDEAFWLITYMYVVISGRNSLVVSAD